MKKMTAALLAMMIALMPFAALAEELAAPAEPMPVKVLLLPKFEVGELAGDFPGEAQYYYEAYLQGAETYEIANGGGLALYCRDGVALCVLGMGKVSAAMGTLAILCDSRFDFSDAYIISTGCAGSSAGNTVMGDVFIISAAVDYDLGHHVDSRELADPNGRTWFHDPDYDDAAVVMMNSALTDKVYALVRDVPLETTERTHAYMRAAFDGADWAVRNPMVLRGTAVTGDNYWKGDYGHANAVLMTETYQCPDPYAVTEMEDIAVARAAERMGLLDRLIIIRDSVNMDVFMLGTTPESLWDPENQVMDSIASEDSVEAEDIFATAMKNNFEVGRVIIDQILQGQF
ncbi:MAG: hypothetical protein IKP40_06995 [Clostridia bacterium]|nr:hypothetical protein [Clostridia bacterium]